MRCVAWQAWNPNHSGWNLEICASAGGRAAGGSSHPSSPPRDRASRRPPPCAPTLQPAPPPPSPAPQRPTTPPTSTAPAVGTVSASRTLQQYGKGDWKKPIIPIPLAPISQANYVSPTGYYEPQFIAPLAPAPVLTQMTNGISKVSGAVAKLGSKVHAGLGGQQAAGLVAPMMVSPVQAAPVYASGVAMPAYATGPFFVPVSATGRFMSWSQPPRCGGCVSGQAAPSVITHSASPPCPPRLPKPLAHPPHPSALN
jgi:hypothetical protein